jgi:NTE family protein
LDEFYESGLAKESGFSLILETAGQQPEAWHEKIEIWIKRAYVQARFVSRQTVLDSRVFRQLIEFFIPKMNIEDLPLPFAAVSTDLNSGRPVLFKTGPLRAAVYASAAIPGLVMPLSYEDMLLVDGGVLHLVPVLAARTMGADAVVASSVDQPIDLHRELNTALDLLFRVEEVQNTCLMKQHLLAADLVVKPETDRVHWSDFDHADELIQAGHNTTAMLMDRIVALKRRRLAFRRPGPAGVLAPMREWIVI